MKSLEQKRINSIISRGLDYGLTFEAIYFLLNGDYAGTKQLALENLVYYLNEDLMSHDNFISLTAKLNESNLEK